jgi:YebC/PmpR family DNA-binding regulatory protein
MGRAFEYRKATKFARWAKMSKTFTKLGKQITIAVKAGGSDPNGNSKLRALIQNARAENMPKDRIEAAIKRATDRDVKDLQEELYEGYGPHGVAILVETATDNPTRTVANLRVIFGKNGGNLATSGSVGFLFERKAVFRVGLKGIADPESLELELIDFGLEELAQLDGEAGPEAVLIADFENYGAMQKGLEDKGIEIISSELRRFPTTSVKLTEAQTAELETLLEKIEEDDDVQTVFHNLDMSE